MKRSKADELLIAIEHLRKGQRAMSRAGSYQTIQERTHVAKAIRSLRKQWLEETRSAA